MYKCEVFRFWYDPGTSEAASCDPGHCSAYDEDLRWRIVYQGQVVHVMVLIHSITEYASTNHSQARPDRGWSMRILSTRLLR